MVGVVDRQRAATAGGRLPYPTERRRDVELGQPVRAYRRPVSRDLGHVLAQTRLMPGHPLLGAGAALLVAAAAPA